MMNTMEQPVTTADAHSQWHAIHGALAVCPLDCGIADSLLDEQEPAVLVACGHCKGRHTVAGVRDCSRA